MERVGEEAEERGLGGTLVNRRMVHHFEHLPMVYSVDYIDDRGRRYDNFEFAPFEYYGTGHCVTSAMLQFAYYLTRGAVLLVGVDHKFTGDDWHFFPDEDVPAFHTMPKESYMKFRQRVDPFFEQVASIYENTGRELINLTPDSHARMFKTGSYDEWIT